MSTDVYRCLQMSTDVYRCLQVSTGVYRCLQMSTEDIPLSPKQLYYYSKQYESRLTRQTVEV
jgi:hypothetical protein